jgi:hypothetical protein
MKIICNIFLLLLKIKYKKNYYNYSKFKKRSQIKWNSNDNSINRISFLGNYELNKKGLPMNPVGRTGISGRGLLGNLSLVLLFCFFSK